MIHVTLIKGALNFLKNNIQCITDTGQAVLELLWSKVATGNPHRSRKLSFSDLSTSPLVPKMTELLITYFW